MNLPGLKFQGWMKLALAAVLILPFVAPPVALAGDKIDPKNPPQGTFIDEWAEVLMQGSKVGYGHTTVTRHGDQIRTATAMKMKLARAGINVSIEVQQSTVETLGGEAVEFESVMLMGDPNNPVRTKGVFEGRTVHCTSSQFGMENKQSYELKSPDGKPHPTLMAWGLLRESLLRGYEPGTQYTLLTFSPEVRMDGLVEAVTKIGQDETFQHRGKPMTGRRVELSIVTPLGKVDTTSWIDPSDGTTLRSTVAMGGISMEMYSVDQASAVADFIPAELFMSNTVPVDKPIAYKEAKQITYRLSPKDGATVKFDLPETSMQKVVAREGDTLTLQLTRVDQKALATNGSPAGASTGSPATASTAAPAASGSGAKTAAAPAPGDTPDDRSEFLESNILINTRDPQIIELGRKAGGGEKDPLKLADKLRVFVTDYIDAKGMDVGFATAGEVCRSKKGDCSEHAVLLAALGRVNGLPSRVAVGLAYVPLFGNQQNIFGFHMWTQFLVHGAWVDFDAAIPESDCSPTRIAFDVSSLRETALVEMSFKLMEVFGRLKLDVMEIKTLSDFGTR